MGTVHTTDEALLQSGDLEDFGRFYDRYVRSLLALFQHRTRDPETAADLTAETFAAAMIARERYRGGTKTAAAWLFGFAQHKLADYRRRGTAEDRMRSRLRMQRVEVTAEDADMIRWLGEDVAAQMVEDLPVEQRDAIRAHVLEDRDYADIARSEQLSEATVRKRVSRGLRVLRERRGGIDEQRLHRTASARAPARRSRRPGSPPPRAGDARAFDRSRPPPRRSRSGR